MHDTMCAELAIFCSWVLSGGICGSRGRCINRRKEEEGSAVSDAALSCHNNIFLMSPVKAVICSEDVLENSAAFWQI